VPYPAPTATGGTPPIAVTCSPPSGTSFPLGVTTVNCSATDNVRTAACSFKVTLVPPQPVLGVQDFLAFGDSITVGENGQPASLKVIDGANSYPMQLLGLMQARYITQSPQVHNCGLPGETAQDGALRIGSVLGFYMPDVLLLLEGAESLTGNFTKDAPVVQGALAADIAAAKAHNLSGIFLSTLLPVFPGNCTPMGTTCRGAGLDNGEITNMNGVIYALAAQQNVPLVDNYTAFSGHPEYIDQDGFHPLPLGNQVMAKQFLAAIQSKFEGLAPTRTQGASRVRGASPLATSPQCPYDGNTSVVVSRSRGR
jgi:lysophospholipase L1-like esterase